ncbi:MAG: hypothetical protein F6K22_03825 [Okeania sp. SIO2F4]|uniref:hypothetical protein n=1 Tax=Okeania sp. SIO2F4 TaxID=2607790 RepID=UPI00142D0DAA|nr:hypothetical protein [Okeania sp. SIO2F4]NES02034.1 hypothetical protein [Okeania sp. SIO2F4]
MLNPRKIHELSVLLNLPQITQKAKGNHVQADYKRFSVCTNVLFALDKPHRHTQNPVGAIRSSPLLWSTVQENRCNVSMTKRAIAPSKILLYQLSQKSDRHLRHNQRR